MSAVFPRDIGWRPLKDGALVGELPPDELKRCLLLVCWAGSAISGFQWQAFVPSISLVLTRGLELKVDSIGHIYLVFMGASVIGYVSLPSILRRMTPFMVMRRCFELRVASAVIHIVGLWSRTVWTMPLMLVSRAIHGYTLMLVPLSVIWIGTHVPNDDKPSALAVRNMAATTGVTTGLCVGGLLTSLVSTPMMAGAAPAWLLILSSVVSWVWLDQGFTDRRMLPHTPTKTVEDSGISDAQVPWLHVLITGFANFLGWGGYIAFEGTFTVLLIDDFGWSSRTVILGWAPVAVAAFAGTWAFNKMRKSLWSQQAPIYVAACALGVAGLLLIGSNLAGTNLSWLSSSLFVTAVTLCIFSYAISFTVVNAQLLLHVPAHMQPQIQSPVQLMATLGRGLGPYVGALMMDISHNAGGPIMLGSVQLAAHDLVGIFSWLVLLVATWVPIVWRHRFFSQPVARQSVERHVSADDEFES